jgi:HlyD family secretion protein
MISRFTRFRRAALMPVTVVVSLALLGAGLANSTANGNLTEATDEDKAAAAADYAPATGLDVKVGLPVAGEVGGAGAIEPLDRPVSLAPEVSGVVAEVLVQEGQTVTQGQDLVRLHDATARADTDAARAEARVASAEVTAVRADADAASARADLSRAAAERSAALVARSATTPEDHDRAERTRDADAATARAASARTDQASARLRAAEARVALAEARVAQLTVRAPIAGEVLQILVRPGEAASPQAGLLIMGDTSKLRARIDVNERDVTALRVGLPARVRVEGSVEDLPGRVVEVARRVGRKNVRTEDPTDRQDVRFVETVVELDAAPRVPVGIRVSGYIKVQ